MKIKKGDTVRVLSGEDKRKKGKVLEVIAEEGKVVVERVNVAKKHQRPTRDFPGGIIEKPVALAVSKVMLLCPRCGQGTRIKMSFMENKKVRSCKRCGEVIDKI